MSASRFVTTAESSPSPTSVSAELMLRRVLGVARIITTVKYTHDCDEEIAENRTKNRHPGELQYREDELTTHSA